jgi:diacylglycerol kinase
MAVIGHAKDVAAGAVLIAAIAAVIVGAVVFSPHILVLMR